MDTQEMIGNLKDIYWWLKGFQSASKAVDGYCKLEEEHTRALQEAVEILKRRSSKES